MNSIDKLSKLIIEQLKYIKLYDIQMNRETTQTPETLYDEITEFANSTFGGNAKLNFGRSTNPRSVHRSDNFQYFVEWNGSITISNKFFI